MSLAAVDPESQRDVALLQDLLHKREYHLAELIDEVVFAEQERFKAVQEAHNVRELATHLENAFDKLLQYHITMHKEVLLPTLAASVEGEGKPSRRPSTPARADGVCNDGNFGDENGAFTGAASPSNDFLNDLLTDPQLSRETKQLLHAVVEQRGGLGETGRNELSRPPPPSRGAADSSSDVALHATHRAIVLSDSLLKNQETLTRLLRSIQDQAEAMLRHGTASTTASSSRAPTPAVTARADPNMVHTPSQRSAAASKQRTSDVSPVAPFRLENLYQHSDRAREIEAALRNVEAERDTLQRQLRDREHAATAAATATSSEKEAWGKERVHLKQELAYAQQRALEEQARCRELKKQVTQLEQVAAASPISAAPARTTPCSRCEKARSELKAKAADYHAAKAAWQEEEHRLRREIEALQKDVREAAVKAERNLLTAPAPTATTVVTTTTTDESPRYHSAGPSSERKIGQLEATVASMKADLQIMEMRMAIVQDEREAERRRLLSAHAQERERLRRERDECQAIIDKMSRELQGLSRCVTAAPPAIASASP